MDGSHIKNLSVLCQSCLITYREIQKDHYTLLKILGKYARRKFERSVTYKPETLPKSVKDNIFVSVITAQQRLPLLQLSTQPSAAEGDNSTCTLSPKRPRSTHTLIEWAVETLQTTNIEPLFTHLFHTTAQTIYFPLLQ